MIYGKTYGTTTTTYRYGSRTTRQCGARPNYELLPCWFSTATSLFCNYWKCGGHFVQKVIFTIRILVSSILEQYSEEIPALNDIMVMHLLLDGGHFGHCPPRRSQVSWISHASISENVHGIVMYIFVPILGLLSRSERLVWYAAAWVVQLSFIKLYPAQPLFKPLNRAFTGQHSGNTLEYYILLQWVPFPGPKTLLVGQTHYSEQWLVLCITLTSWILWRTLNISTSSYFLIINAHLCDITTSTIEVSNGGQWEGKSVHNSTIKVHFRTIITWQCQPTIATTMLAVARTFVCPSRELKHFHYTWCFLLPKSVIGFATHFGIKKQQYFKAVTLKSLKSTRLWC